MRSFDSFQKANPAKPEAMIVGTRQINKRVKNFGRMAYSDKNRRHGPGSEVWDD